MIMILFVAITILLAIATADPLPPPGQCVSGAYPPKQSTEVPTYVINLDLPPEQRWTQLVSEKKKVIKEFIGVLRNFANVLVGDKLIKLIDKKMPYILESLPEPFASEIRGIAKATGIPLGEILLFNIYYEVFNFCLSIVAQDEKGALIHARNLDFGTIFGWDAKNNTWRATEALRPVIVQLHFQRQGQIIFKSAHIAGYVGVVTAIKPKQFTLTVNSRSKSNLGIIGFFKWMLGYRSGKWMAFLTREIMENATSYEEAYSTLSKINLMAPAYFILGGNTSQQACIITKNRGTSDPNVLTMKDSSNGWYLVETNYDHWESPPSYDDRRTPAVKCMNQMSQQNVSFSGIFNVLSTQPLLNKMTAYTCLMNVANGKMEVYIQDCTDPCAIL